MDAAKALKQRVSQRGEAADGGDFGEYSKDLFWFYWTPWPAAYHPKVGRKAKDIEGAFYADPWEFYEKKQGDLKRRFNASGRMWDSLTVSLTRNGSFRIFFAKSSLGYGSKKTFNKKTSNNLKAWVCSTAAKKNILEPSSAELQPIIEYVALNARHAIDGTPLVTPTAAIHQGAFGPLPQVS